MVKVGAASHWSSRGGPRVVPALLSEARRDSGPAVAEEEVVPLGRVLTDPRVVPPLPPCARRGSGQAAAVSGTE